MNATLPDAVVGPAPERPSLAARAVGSSAWNITNQGIQVLLGFGSFWLLSRRLSPMDYGLFGMAATVTFFFGVIGDAGITSAVVRLPQLDDHVEATAFWVSLGAAGLLTLVCGCAAPIIGWFYRDRSITPLALGMAATFVLAAPGRVSTGKLVRELRFRTNTLIGISATGASLGLAVLAANRGLGAWALVFQTGGSLAIQSLLSTLVAPPRMRIGLISRTCARELSTFTSQLSGASLAASVARALDNVLAGRFLGSSAVGFMATGVKLAYFPIERFCGAVNGVFLPTTVALNDTAQRARAYKAAIRLLMIAVAPICLGIFAIAPEIVVALLPARWSGLAPLLRVYSLASIILPISYLSLSILIARARTRVLFLTSLALIPICWTGAALGAFEGSVLAMAMAWGFATVVNALITFWFAWKELHLTKDFWTALTVPLAVSGGMAVIVRLILNISEVSGTPFGFVLGATTGAVIYVILAWITMRGDISRVVSLIRKPRPGAAVAVGGRGDR